MGVESDSTQTTHPVRAVLSAWVLILGVDFFFNAGVLSPLWREQSPFLLPPEELFARIPLGYAAFLLWAVLVVWLLARLDIRKPRAGALFATKVGVLVSTSGILAIVSVSTISASLAVGWMALQIAEFAAAGYVGGLALRAEKSRVLLRTTGVAVLLAIAGVVAQNLM